MRCLSRPLAAGLAVALRLAVPASAVADPGDTFSDRFTAPLTFLRQWFHDEPAHIVRSHDVAVSSEGGSLAFEFADGGSVRLALRDGHALIGERVVGDYPDGGALEAAWRQFILDASRSGTAAVLTNLRSWQPDGLNSAEQNVLVLFHQRLTGLSAPAGPPALPQAVPAAEAGGFTIDLSDLSNPRHLEPLLRRAAALQGTDLRVTVPGGQVREGHFSLGSGERLNGNLLVLRGDADVFGTLAGNLAMVEGNVIVHPGAVITGDVLAVAGDVRDQGGDIQGQIRTLRSGSASHRRSEAAQVPVSPVLSGFRNTAGLVGVLVTLLLIGTGLVMFARQPLEVVSDTVTFSFGRSLLVGLLGQMLVLPTFGMLVVGLILSVVGILLLPFAVILFSLLFLVAVLGGFLAVAHAMGERYTRRQLALGASIASANSYRYVSVGLLGISALWLVWVLFGWVPIAGTLVFASAALVTWLLGTVGFGAALLSRAGFREHFAGRILPAESLTDEYLWATPQFGVTAVKRATKSKTPPPL